MALLSLHLERRPQAVIWTGPPGTPRLQRPPCLTSPNYPTTPRSKTESPFTDSALSRKYPSAVASWENAWERFTPFLAFGPAVRRVIYTTNSIESLNYQLRKIIKDRGHFPNDAAAVKLLWLAIMSIEDKRTRERAKEHGTPKGQSRKASGRLVEGAVTQGWKAALGELSLVYSDRINNYL